MSLQQDGSAGEGGTGAASEQGSCSCGSGQLRNLGRQHLSAEDDDSASVSESVSQSVSEDESASSDEEEEVQQQQQAQQQQQQLQQVQAQQQQQAAPGPKKACKSRNCVNTHKDADGLLPMTAFGKSKATADGLRPQCRSCTNRASRISKKLARTPRRGGNIWAERSQPPRRTKGRIDYRVPGEWEF